MLNPNQEIPHNPDRASPIAWAALTIGCALFLAGSIGFLALYGVPGTSGGTSPNQQQTSGAPEITRDTNDGSTRQTTGQGQMTPPLPAEDRQQKP